MHASLKELLSHSIDYAGMFPPARLSLDVALANYLCYKLSPNAWMLGRFVCPAASLPELQNSPHWSALRRYPLALIGPGDIERDDYVKRLTGEIEASKAVRSADAESNAQTNAERQSWSFELKFTPVAIGAHGAAPSIFDVPKLARECCEEVFLEVPLQGGDHLRTFAAHVGCSSGKWGLKFRTGPTADLIPSAKHLAGAIRLCCEYGIRFKVTAGLHQPLRHYDRALGTLAHGFLNLLGAAVLAHARQLDEPQIEAVLKEELPESFQFSEAGFRWRDFEVTIPEIEAARRASMVSFGSCSFDEPVQGLKALGLIE